MLLQRAQMHPRIAQFVFLSVLTRTFSVGESGGTTKCRQTEVSSELISEIRGEGDRL